MNKIKAILDQKTGKIHTIESEFDEEIALVNEDGEVTSIPISDWLTDINDQSGYIKEAVLKAYDKLGGDQMKTFIEIDGDQSVLHHGIKVSSPDTVVRIKAIFDQMMGDNHTIKSTVDGEISLVTDSGVVTNIPIDDWFMYSGGQSGFITEEMLNKYYKEYEVPEVEELEHCPYVTVYFHKRETPLRFENVWGYLEMGSNYRFNYISQSTGVECSGVFPKENVDCILLGGNVIGEGPKEQA